MLNKYDTLIAVHTHVSAPTLTYFRMSIPCVRPVADPGAVEGELCAQHLDDQEVHRVADRQAVHRADAQRRRRIQLRGLNWREDAL